MTYLHWYLICNTCLYNVDDVNNRFDQSFWLNFLVNFFSTDSLSDKKSEIENSTSDKSDQRWRRKWWRNWWWKRDEWNIEDVMDDLRLTILWLHDCFYWYIDVYQAGWHFSWQIFDTMAVCDGLCDVRVADKAVKFVIMSHIIWRHNLIRCKNFI